MINPATDQIVLHPQALTWVEIDVSKLKHNLRSIHNIVSRNKFTLQHRDAFQEKAQAFQQIIPVIKADAYGHGMLNMIDILKQEHFHLIAVSDVAEGILLREHDYRGEVLLLEHALKEQTKDIVAYELTPTLCDLGLAVTLNEMLIESKKSLKVHVNVDTGMHRLGVDYLEAEEFIEQLFSLQALKIEGMYTHLPCADTDPQFTQKQINAMADLIHRLDQKSLIVPYVHAANSMGIAGYETGIFNRFRPGLMLYGLSPDERIKAELDLKPLMQVKSRIIHLKNLYKNQALSYGHSYRAATDMTIAVIPIGYADGYFRSLSNNSFVLIGGEKCPLVGIVTMDQIMVDVSTIEDVALGDEVVLLGEQKGASVTADDLAKWAGTINYEIICALGNRLPRRIINQSPTQSP